MVRRRYIVMVALAALLATGIWQWPLHRSAAPRPRRSTRHVEPLPAKPREEEPAAAPVVPVQANPDLGIFADRFFNIDELRNVGSATPEAALETFFWAATSADPEMISLHVMSRYDLYDETKTRLTKAILKNLGAIEALKVEAHSSRMDKSAVVKIRYQQNDGDFAYGVFNLVLAGNGWKIDVRDIDSARWELERWQREPAH